MKNFLFFMLGILLISSCVGVEDIYTTNALPLRQLVNSTSVYTKESGSFFLITGSYSKSEKEVTKVKMFAEVDSSYRLIETNISNVRIHVDNSIKDPYIKIRVLELSNEKLISDVHAVNVMNDHYTNRSTVHIYCSEELLPEKLLPIEL